ncbi:DUF6064 family protein [Anderseniella sp. Alg231-50]|uniref:DUF6064 family protein n=1 Tax=Anderseniella sp. Alg231-50 TaxID=1922226 RepID=UPI000D55CE96
MAEWSSYSLSDLLLFSLQAYIGLFEPLNTTLWPAHLATLALGLTVGLLVLKQGSVNNRLVWSMLGLLWIWTGSHFFFVQYAAINLAAGYIAPVFWLQGLLFAWFAAAPKCPDIRYTGTAAGRTAMVLYLFALIGYPAATLALGRSLDSVEFIGISADPGVVATLAVLVLSHGSLTLLAWIVPLAWCALTGLTLWMLGSAEFFIAPLSGAMAVAATIAGRRVSQTQ